MNDRWEAVSALFHAALKRSPEERIAFLEEACGEDHALRQELEDLLQYKHSTADFLETPAAALMGNGHAPSARLIGRRIGPYRVDALLGAGGMGEVYRARDTKLGRDVAIKILPPHLIDVPKRRVRFAREARILAKLNHPNIGAIYGLEELDGTTALVLEFVEGPTLAERLAAGPLALNDALTIARQIAAALDAAHVKGILHRDLKPTNVILQGTTSVAAEGTRVRVLDFGLGKLPATAGSADAEDRPSNSSETAVGVILGTPAYMSPEQVRGHAVDARSDVWAFGCLLFEMMAGQRPYAGGTIADMFASILEHEPDWTALRADTPPQIRRLLERCLQKDVNERLGQIADAARAIDDSMRRGSGVGERTGRLPQQLTRFIGRDREISEVRSALREVRLITLTGVGGIGKTRLALQVAADALPEYADGVWFVDLAPVSDPDFALQTVASVLDIHEERGEALIETLRMRLSPKSLLLVLDNCEHLVGACAQLADTLLRGCPQLRILATSREALAISGEEIFQVPSMRLPDPDQSSDPASIRNEEAVQLFVDRVRLVKSTFALSESNAVAVAKICVALEGIPLAIELAASRMRALAVDQIVAKLHDRLALLTRGSRTAAGRHQTLIAAIDWSYNLLSDGERKLFRRLAVFSGGWTLEAAEAICAGDRLGRDDVLDLLAGLVDKSLVLADERQGHQRYRFMVMLLEYAQRCLRQSDEAPALQRTHAEFFTDLAVEGAAHLMRQDQETWLERLRLEYDNIRGALSWATNTDVELALRLGGALGRFWYLRGYWDEGRRWLTELLQLEDTHSFPALRAEALNAAARLAVMQGDDAAAQSTMEEALSLARACGDEHQTADALNTAALLEVVRGEFGTARVLLEETLTIRRRLGHKAVIGLTLNNLGILACLQTEYKTARALFDESLATFRDIEDRHGIAVALVNQGDLLTRIGDDAAARPLLEEGLALARSLGDKALIPFALNTLGDLACQQGEYEAARVLNEEALEISRQVGDKRLVAATLLSLGKVSEHRREYGAALSVFEKAVTLLRDLGDKPKLAGGLNCVARLIARNGDLAAARALYEESLELCERMGMRDRIAESLLGLASIAESRGDHVSALGFYKKGLAILEEIGSRRQVPRVLEQIAALLLLNRRAEDGASLLGAAQAIRETAATTPPLTDRAEAEQQIEHSRGELGQERFATAWARGHAMTPEQAVACALNAEL